MSEVEKITVEGATLADATRSAATSLGIPVAEVQYEFDREHLASGASTVRIFASKGDAAGSATQDDRRRRSPQRDDVIRKRANAAIAGALEGGEEVVVVDLNSYERRLVHMLVREAEGLKSHSVGDGLRKDVVISHGDPDAPADDSDAADDDADSDDASDDGGDE